MYLPLIIDLGYYLRIRRRPRPSPIHFYLFLFPSTGTRDSVSLIDPALFPYKPHLVADIYIYFGI